LIGEKTKYFIEAQRDRKNWKSQYDSGASNLQKRLSATQITGF